MQDLTHTTQSNESNIQLSKGDNTMENLTQTTESDESNIQLSNGRHVPLWLLNWVRDVVMLRSSEIPPHTELELKQICGEYLWNSLTPGQGHRKRAGWCMKHLVAKGELKLRIVEWEHEYPVHYQLI